VTPSRYRIVETIGKGGMGEVCLAEDLQLHRRVALKFLTASAERDAMDRLLDEARSAAALDHPFICRIYEVTELDGRPCIVMEYVRGETMERRLKRERLAAAEALRVAEEVAEALEAAHKRRVVHRDLKPANVMITEDLHIKVMDFGLAARLRAGESVGQPAGMIQGAESVLVGTPAYMAPEQVQGSPPGRASDIFSFGVVLYELLTGTHPFLRTTFAATVAAIVSEWQPRALHEQDPRIPKSVSALVAGLLQKEPSRRYASFAEIRAELRRAASDVSSFPAPVRTPVAEQVAAERAGRVAGREGELKTLVESVQRAAAGHGGLVFLRGEAGIGKSRLADAVLASAREFGCQTLAGRCAEQDGTPPLIAYMEIFEDAARVIPAPVFREAVGRSAPELVRLLPEIHRLVPDVPPPLELPPELRQRFLFTNVREFLTRSGHVTPLVLCIDDFQWADEATIQLTQHLAQHIHGLPILLVVACRDADAAPSRPPASGLRKFFQRMRGHAEPSTAGQTVTRAVDQLVAQRQAQSIRLRPLGEGAVRAMLATLGPGEPPQKVVRRFVEETDGNPFFVEELYRHLMEAGRLLDRRGSWHREIPGDDLALPAGVRATIERRLERLSEGTHAVLTAAAIVGRRFDVDLLERVADGDAARIMGALEDAERADLVKGPSGRLERHWRFTHHVIWQALTGAVTQSRRQRLHLRVAAAIGTVDPSSTMYASELAHHLYAAGPLADALQTARALVTAGDAAYSLYATEDAVRHYRRALEILNDRGGEDVTRAAVQERLGDLLALTGDRPGAMEQYGVLAAAHAAAGDRAAEARTIRKVGTLHWHGGERTEAMASYQRALALVESVASKIDAAHVYQELGLAAFRSGDNARAIEWAERALDAAEAALAAGGSAPADRRAATAAIAHASNTIGVALARSGQLDAARARIEQSIASARQQDLLDVACRGYANLGVVYGSVEPQRAIDVSLTGLELAAKIGAVSLQSYIYANLAAAYCALTDQCESEGLVAARAAAALDRELGQLDHLAVPLIVLGQIHQCHGRLDEAQASYREALALAEKAGEPQLLLPCYDGLATIHLDRGDRQLAEQFMVKAKELCERTGLDPDDVLLLPFLC
jgi:adenylate cyclase